MENVGYIFIQTVAYITFAMFLAILFRRSGAAIAVFFLYGLIFEWLITVLINFKLDLTPVGYFLPSGNGCNAADSFWQKSNL